MTHLSPIENLFAVPCPDTLAAINLYGNAKGASEIWGIDFRIVNGFPKNKSWNYFLPFGSYEILFTTINCTEDLAAGVVDSHWDTELGAMRYGVLKNNTMDNLLPTEALSGLLRANGLNPESKNYLLIKKAV